MTARFYWMSVVLTGVEGNGRFTDTVSADKHPFDVVRSWGDPAIYGRATLISWREITKDEYFKHPEHLPEKA